MQQTNKLKKERESSNAKMIRMRVNFHPVISKHTITNGRSPLLLLTVAVIFFPNYYLRFFFLLCNKNQIYSGNEFCMMISKLKPINDFIGDAKMIWPSPKSLLLFSFTLRLLDIFPTMQPVMHSTYSYPDRDFEWRMCAWEVDGLVYLCWSIGPVIELNFAVE